MPWFGVVLLGPDGRPVPPGRTRRDRRRDHAAGLVFPGYFDAPEATAEALRDGRLHTGDLGSFDADGSLFAGRMKDSVRRRGENVSAWEVEHVAAEHEAVEDAP